MGIFISFEGIDGVGKTSLMHLVSEWLVSNARVEVVMTREPGGTDNAELIRELLMKPELADICPSTEALLMFAARNEHLQHKILPALKKGHWVLCDRFTDATYAYQSNDGRLDENFIDHLVGIVHHELWPDLTFWLDAPVVVAQQRIQKKGVKNRFDTYSVEQQQKIYDAYARRWRQFPKRIKRINANQDLTGVLKQVTECLHHLIERI